MKYETIYMMVRVLVYADHSNTCETIREVEKHSVISFTDTANVDILEAEILVSKVRKRKPLKSLLL